MNAARKKPQGPTTPFRLFDSSITQLKEMSFYSEKILGKREWMQEIAEKAIQEYFNNHFKGKIPE